MTAPTLVYRSTRRWLPGVVLVAGVIVFFLSAKFFLFRHLEYTSDLFSHLQMSRNVPRPWIPRG
jgi:hypothetical protein